VTEPPRVTPTGPRADAGAGRILFIGIATTLIRAAGFTILTDPNFLHRGDRAYLGMGLTTKRLTEPALSIGELPPLDFVVLSHHHGANRNPLPGPRRQPPPRPGGLMHVPGAGPADHGLE
jgi:hypothetical protein